MNEHQYKYECDHGIKGNHPFVHEIGPQTIGANSKVPLGTICHPRMIVAEQ